MQIVVAWKELRNFPAGQATSQSTADHCSSADSCWGCAKLRAMGGTWGQSTGGYASTRGFKLEPSLPLPCRALKQAMRVKASSWLESGQVRNNRRESKFCYYYYFAVVEQVPPPARATKSAQICCAGRVILLWEQALRTKPGSLQSSEAEKFFSK